MVQRKTFFSANSLCVDAQKCFFVLHITTVLDLTFSEIKFIIIIISVIIHDGSSLNLSLLH